MNAETSILIIDDDPDLLNLLALSFSKNGFHVYAYSSAMNFFSMIMIHHPTVILLDINMGIADGRDLCRLLKKHKINKTIPIVLMSGGNYSEKEVLDYSSCNGYIAKPFSMDFIINMIQENLN